LRAVLVGIVALLLLLAATLVVGPGFVDWQAAKPRLEAELSRAVGRPVAVDGALSLSLLPRPRVTAEGLRVANRSQGSEAELLRVARLEMRLAPLPLLSGRFEVQSLRLIRPVLLLERLEDGSGNWIAPRPAARAFSRDRLLDVLSLEAVELRDGELVWRDHRAGQEERFTGLDALLAAESLRGPLSSQGRLLYRDREVAFDLGLGGTDRHGGQPFSLQLALPEAAGAELRLVGRLEPGAVPAAIGGRLQLRGPDTAALLRELGIDLSPSLSLEQPLDLAAALRWDDGGLTLEAIEADLGEARLEGRLALRPGPAPRLDLALTTRFLDLDLLRGADGPDWPRFLLPAGLEGELELTAERLLLYGGSLRGLRLAGRFERGGLLVEEAAVQLPGGARLSLEGRWQADRDLPRFAGRFEARSTNLRAQLAWLDLEPEGVGGDRLRRFALEAVVEASPELVTLTEATLDLDLSRVTGGLALAPRRRPAFGLRLDLDRLNLDAYLGAATLPDREILARFDANLDLRAERLILGGRYADDLMLEGTLQRGELELRHLRIGDLAGARLRAAGRFEGLADALPQLAGASLEVEAPDSARLLDGLGLAAPELLRRLGAFSLSGSLSGDRRAAEVNLDLAARGAQAFLALSLEEEGEGWRIAEGRLDLDSLPAADAAALLGYAGAGWPARLGRLDLESAFSESGGLLAHATRLRTGGAELRLEGSSAGLWDGPLLSAANLELSHPDGAALLHSLLGRDPELAPAPLTLRAAVEASPERLSLESLEGRFGDAPLRGRLERTLGAADPRLDLELVLESLTERALLVPLLGAELLDRPLLDEEGRWVRAALPLAGLRGPAVTAKLRLGRLEVGDAAFTDVELAFARERGELTLPRFTARFGEGRVEAEGLLAVRPPERLEARWSLRAEAFPAPALAALAGLEVPGGSLDLSLRGETAGRSAAELAAGLSAEGALEGVLRLPPAPPLDGGPLEVAFRRLLGEMESEEARLTGAIGAERGRLRSDSLRLAGDRRVLLVEGLLADLPRRRSDFTARLESAAAGRPLARLEVQGPFAAPEVRLQLGATAAVGTPLGPPVSAGSTASPAAFGPHRP